MTRKDYVAIAGILAELRECVPLADAMDIHARKILTAVAYRIMDLCARDNPRFDSARFLKACGVQS